MSSLQGKKNIYRCQKCGGQFVTVDLDHGVTPFMTNCRAKKNCAGMAQSQFYRVDQSLPAKFEWYRPEPDELRGKSDATIAHVSKGGLLLRPI